MDRNIIGHDMIYHNYYKQLEVFESVFYKFEQLMIYQQTSRLMVHR